MANQVDTTSDVVMDDFIGGDNNFKILTIAEKKGFPNVPKSDQ